MRVSLYLNIKLKFKVDFSIFNKEHNSHVNLLTGCGGDEKQ